jgi:two-component system chemotaxis sensor kinase CheA
MTWTAGQGTTIVLECPPTLATMRVLLTGVGAQVIAIPALGVERLLRVRQDDIRRAEGREIITTPDGPVPLVALARLLPPLTARPSPGAVPVLLLCSSDRRLAVAVDELFAEQEVVVRPLGPGGDTSPHVTGAAILSTGRVALVLNSPVVISAGLSLGTGDAIAFEAARPQGHARRRVLVVDDSLTTRTLEQSVLEAAGYEVYTAVDGADGWRQLEERGADAVISDVEMPRMDGFGLLEAIRGSRRFAQLPVVLVTALESAEHRARGLQGGADAYLGKSSFDQRALLETVAQLIGRGSR